MYDNESMTINLRICTYAYTHTVRAVAWSAVLPRFSTAIWLWFVVVGCGLWLRRVVLFVVVVCGC
eukprot:11227572-Lingulodinium_polyedra.AAC.1